MELERARPSAFHGFFEIVLPDFNAQAGFVRDIEPAITERHRLVHDVAAVALISLMSFIASTMQTVSPARTWSPGCTNGGLLGEGAA